MAGRAKHIIDIGDRFGDWIVIDEPFPRDSFRHYLCQCSCGKQKRVPASNLVGKRSTRCASCSVRAMRRKPDDKATAAMFTAGTLKSLPRLSVEQLHQVRAAIDRELDKRDVF